MPVKKIARTPPPTALVVDDNPMCRELAAETLRAQGVEVIVAKDGFEAIRVLSRGAGRLAILVVDTEMPGVHGWEVIRFARTKAPTMTILRLGRASDDAPGGDYRALAAVPVLRKPFTVGELISSLEPRTRRVAAGSNGSRAPGRR